MTQAEQKFINDRIIQELEADVAFAEASPLPDANTALPGVYSD
jgi:TPP-dependent pyruvate/acetoin dehydrogenase alpha subunit